MLASGSIVARDAAPARASASPSVGESTRATVPSGTSISAIAASNTVAAGRQSAPRAARATSRSSGACWTTRSSSGTCPEKCGSTLVTSAYCNDGRRVSNQSATVSSLARSAASARPKRRHAKVVAPAPTASGTSRRRIASGSPRPASSVAPSNSEPIATANAMSSARPVAVSVSARRACTIRDSATRVPTVLISTPSGGAPTRG